MRLRTGGALLPASLALGAILLCICGEAALAQRFQYTYGTPGSEAGHGGVRRLSDRGYIAIGESSSGASGTVDIYLVRTNSDGSHAWSRLYDLGGDERGNDIEEVRLDPVGGFIITGSVDNSGGCGRLNDVFLLRIDPCGDVLWSETYGTNQSDEIGWDVIEIQYPDPFCSGSVGDFVVAGSSAWAGNPLDGYLLRVHNRPPNNLLWARTYSGPSCFGASWDDYFYGVTEVMTGVGGNKGDLIAVGGSESYTFCGSGFGGVDAWMMRLNACGDGTFAAIYGQHYRDEFRSVVESIIGCPGNIIAVGSSEVMRGIPAPEVFVVETGPDPCKKLTDLTIGDDYDQPDEGYDVEEVLNGTDAGYVVITGFMTLPGGFGGEDVFLQRLKPCGLGLVDPRPMLYGDSRVDHGWSVAPVDPDPPCTDEGYVVAGFTDSFGGARELYLIKTDISLTSDCHETPADAVVYQDVRWDDCVTFSIADRGSECKSPNSIKCLEEENPLCHDAADRCRIARCDCPQPFSKGTLPQSAFPAKNAEIAGALVAYPNPIGRGSMLTLECPLAEEGSVTIVVSDLTGKVIYERSDIHPAGVSHLSLDTEGWSGGAYIVTMTGDGLKRMARIVLTEK